MKGPIYFVGISCTEELNESLRIQLELIYGQVLTPFLIVFLNASCEGEKKRDLVS